MAIDMILAGNVWSQRNFAQFRGWVALLGLWCLGGCSIQDFGYLTNGGSKNTGGSGQSGGATSENHQGGSSNAGGSSNPGGSSNAGGSSNPGGSSNTGGLSNTGGSNTGGSNTGGASSGGTSSTNCSTSTSLDLSGCAFAQTGGQLLVPPSQGFESDIKDWSTTSGHSNALSRVPGNGANCEGSWYMHCDGNLRQTAGWDGPAIEVSSYVTVGHLYQVSVASRQTPSSSCSPAISMKLVLSRTCSTTAYDDLFTTWVLTNWVRLTGQFTLAAPAGCTVPQSVRLYVASNETAPPLASFDVDDFKLIDLSASGTSGTGGTTSAGGTSDTGGTTSAGGTSGAGGTTSAGGASGTGGTTN